jgi:hypothetical protein
MPKVSKTPKKAALIVDEVAEEVVEEEIGVAPPPVELDDDLVVAQKIALRRRREAARLAGFRKLAASTGLSKETTRGITKPLLSLADTRRILSFVPEVFRHSGLDADETKLRIQQHSVPISTAACHVFRGLIESELRKVGLEAVDAAATMGRTRVDAGIMNYVLSKRSIDFFDANDLPLGVVRYAQANGTLGLREDEADQLDEEKKVNRELSKAYSAATKEVTDNKAARKARQLEKQQAKRKLQTAMVEDKVDADVVNKMSKMDQEKAIKGIMAGGGKKKKKSA